MDQTLVKIVNGSLRDCIKSHGAITQDLIGSATRRIVGALEGHLRQDVIRTLQDIAIKEELANRAKIIKEKNHKIVMQGKAITDLLAKLKAHGIEV